MEVRVRTTVLNEPIHASHGLFNGSARIRAVTKDQVHVFEPHALERALEPLTQVLAR
jgi:hypothetical protein